MLFQKSENGTKTILIIYVDDIILTGDIISKMGTLKRSLETEFEVKDLGQMQYFLGMEVAMSKGGISVSQRKYIYNFLKEIGMLGCKPSDIPIDTGSKIEDDGNVDQKDRYQRLAGKSPIPHST